MINEFHIKETDMINKLNDRDQQILTLTHQLKQKDAQLANNNQDLAFKIEQLSQMIEKQAIENRENARLMKELEANNKDLLA
jgi:methyl-accepting chemotaxis protein